MVVHTLSINERTRRWAWLLPATLMLSFGLWRIDRPALWADELATWGAIRQPIGQLLRMLTVADGTKGAYYLFLAGWSRVFGDSTVALRVPSALAMAATAGLLVPLGTRLISRRVGLTAGVLFALIPATSRYAQEARGYAFLLLVAVASTWLLLKLIDDNGARWAVAYALAVALLGWLNVVGLLLLLGHAVAMLWHRGVLRRWLLATGAGVALTAPALWLAAAQAGQGDWIPPMTWRRVVEAPTVLAGSALVGGLVVGLALLAIAPRHREIALLVGCVTGPIVGLAAAAIVTPLWWPRYLLFVVPFLALLAAVTMGRAALTGVAATLGATLLLGAPAQVVIRGPHGHGHATAEVAKIITREARPGDGIAYALDEPVVPWEGRDLVARYVPANRAPDDVFATLPQRANGNFLATECADLAPCLGDTRRLWVVRFDHRDDPLAGLGTPKEALLRERYEVTRVWHRPGLTLALLNEKFGRNTVKTAQND